MSNEKVIRAIFSGPARGAREPQKPKPKRVHVHEVAVRSAIQDILIDVFDLKFDPILKDMPLVMMENAVRAAYDSSSSLQKETGDIVRQRLLAKPVSKSFFLSESDTKAGKSPVRTVWVDGRLVIEVWLNLPVFRTSAAEEARIEPKLVSVSWENP